MSMYPPDWYHDLEAQHDEWVRVEALDQAERLREPDPLVHWPEHDRAASREYLEALKRVSEPAYRERIRAAQPEDDGLGFARALVFALAMMVPVWLLAGWLVIA